MSESESGGAITDDDRERLGEILASNRARGATDQQLAERVETSLREDPVFDAVVEEIETLQDEGRADLRVREIADRLDETRSVVGRVMARLADDGRVECVSRTHPKTYRATGADR